MLEGYDARRLERLIFPSVPAFQPTSIRSVRPAGPVVGRPIRPRRLHAPFHHEPDCGGEILLRSDGNEKAAPPRPSLRASRGDPARRLTAWVPPCSRSVQSPEARIAPRFPRPSLAGGPRRSRQCRSGPPGAVAVPGSIAGSKEFRLLRPRNPGPTVLGSFRLVGARVAAVSARPPRGEIRHRHPFSLII